MTRGLCTNQEQKSLLQQYPWSFLQLSRKSNLDAPHTVSSYLAHELSHLLIYQKIGGYNYICIPSWFTEGLAAFVSDGGGAEKVSDAEVKDAIKSENHFKPIETAGLRDLFFPKYASYWGIRHQFKHHMFYRQCMLFVSFLEKEYPDQFKKFLIDLHKGKDFSDSFRLSFGADTMAKWSEFKNKIIGGKIKKRIGKIQDSINKGQR